MNSKNSSTLTFKGCNYLKQRIILSTLSGKPIKLTDIRCNTPNPGIRPFEVNLLRLMDKLTNGTKIELNDDGTSLLYAPGLLEGGSIQHDTCLEKGIGYYLDILVALGPFCKNALDVKLKGVTNSADSPSIDHIKYSCLPIMKRFLIVAEGLELKVLKRGMMPGGGGEISFKCPIRKNLKAIQCLKTGMVKRIRGVAYGCKVSPALANRAVEAAKGVMLNFLPDIYIHTDQNKGKNSGNSCGYGINLVAETGEEVFYSAEAISSPGTEENKSIHSVPEDIGKEAANRLLEEIYRGGNVDSTFQWLVPLYMALAQKDVSKFLTGPLSQYTIHFLQGLREFFGLTFKLEYAKSEDVEDNVDDEDVISGSNKVMMTCVGIGYSNVSRRVV